MRKECSRRFFLIVILLFALIFTLIPASAAKASSTIDLAPLNTELSNYNQSINEGEMGGRASGIIPAPIDFSYLNSQADQGRFRIVGIDPPPASYDLRDVGKITAVRNQGSAGSCWTFGSLASLESFLLTEETWDFSENNMKNVLADTQPFGYDRGAAEGGNFFMAAAYLTRWSGPISEADDPYNANSGEIPSGELTVRKHIQEVLFINNQDVKHALMTYGAVAATYRHDNLYYNALNYAYYYNGEDLVNHGVAIIGWDDNFAKESFSDIPSNQPAGNGAYLVKNSWGTEWGDGGYFWISYYDSKLGDFSVFNNAESPEAFSGIYQYDPLGWTSMIGSGSNTLYGSNIYTAEGNEIVKAVSFYAMTPNTEYEIKIYNGVSAGIPDSGILGTTVSGTTGYAGYYTILLPPDSPVTILKNTYFSVVVKLTTPGYNYPFAVEMPIPNYSSKAAAAAGQSYVSSTGNSWTDLTTVSGLANTNLCLKAFTESTTLTAPVLTADGTDNTVDNNLDITFEDNSHWRSIITAVKINGTALTSTTDYTIQAGSITLKPSGGNSLLQEAGSKTVSVEAPGYTTVSVDQSILHGVLAGIGVTQQPVPGAASGDAFATQPWITLLDQYNNTVSSGEQASTEVTAASKTGDTWTLGSTTAVSAVNGVAKFTDLTHTMGQTGAKITFSATGGFTVDSQAMDLPGAVPPVLTADTTDNTVDNNLAITFVDNATWRGAITAVKAGGTALTPTTDYAVGEGSITLKPSGGNYLLQEAGSKTVSVEATGYTTVSVDQEILHGALAGIGVTQQPVPGAASGDAFATQPWITLLDQYNNTVSSGEQASTEVTAAPKTGDTWTLGGTTAVSAVNGVAKFTDLTHTMGQTGAKITFSATGGFTVDSQAMDLPGAVPPVLTADTTDNTVDNNLAITFVDNAAWRGAITAVKAGGTAFTPTTDYAVGEGIITLKPSGGSYLLQEAGSKTVSVEATGYTTVSVDQEILHGALAGIGVTQQPVPGAASGDAFATQPWITLLDQYNNTVSSGEQASTEVTAAPKTGDTWTLGGTTAVEAVNGIAKFTDLTHSMGQTGAKITFSAAASFTVDSQAMDLPGAVPPVLTADTTDNTVESDIEISYVDNEVWRTAISAVKVDGTALSAGNDYIVASGSITLKPGGGNALLLASGSKTITVEATGYSPASVTQTIKNGVLAEIIVTQQPIPGTSSGSSFATQPRVTLRDQYGNTVSSGPQATAHVTATPKEGDTWTIGGTTDVQAVGGIAVFSNLSHTGAQTGAKITFSCGVFSVESFAMLLPSTSSNGGGGGGGFISPPPVLPPPPPPSDITNPITEDDKTLEKVLKETGEAILNISSDTDSTVVLSPSVIAQLSAKSKSLSIVNTGIKLQFPVNSLVTKELRESISQSGAVLEIGARELGQSEINNIIANTSPGQSTGIFLVGGAIFELSAQIVSGGAENRNINRIENFSTPVAISVDLSGISLTPEQVSQLNGVRYEKDSEGRLFPVPLGGNYDPASKIFTFYTDRFSLYSIMQYRYEVAISMRIGSNSTTVNGALKPIDVPPSLINNRTMVPLRFIGEALGSEFEWDGITRTVTFSQGAKKIKLVIDKKGPGLDTPPTIVGGRTLVPVRYISEAFGAKVMWFPSSSSVFVYQ